MQNVFILALDESHRKELETVKCKDGCEFHGLLNPEDIVHSEEFSLKKILEDARAELDAFPGTVDAILTHWDFPLSVVAPILCAERGLRSPTLESVLRCSDKYWSRLEQRKAIPNFTPRFTEVDPFEISSLSDIDVEPPFWLKPVASFASQLGFKVNDDGDLQHALEEIRDGIGRIGDPFEDVLDRADIPQEVEKVGGKHCIAEEYLTGIELAHEGSVFNGEVDIHGAIDMVREGEIFTRLEYPSTAPQGILDLMEEATRSLLGEIGFDQGCFNVEYFWNTEADRLTIIEVNPRISQSHAYMFEKVDGRSNHQVAVDIALGRSPTLPDDKGLYGRAAKFHHTTREDGFVESLPDERSIKRAREAAPDVEIRFVAKEGQKLSDLTDQDAYSFDLAEIYLAAADQMDLLKRYDAVVDALDFKISPV